MMTAGEISDELIACGLAPERPYFMSRLFSGSVLIVARPPRGRAGSEGHYG